MVDGGSRKVTYSLPNELLQAMEGMVREGAAPSYSAFVAEAVRERLERLAEERLKEALAAAARDPLFLEDLEATTLAFAVADGVVAGAAGE